MAELTGSDITYQFYPKGEPANETKWSLREMFNSEPHIAVFIIATIAGLWVSYSSFRGWRKHRDVRLAVVAISCLVASLCGIYMIIALSLNR